MFVDLRVRHRFSVAGGYVALVAATPTRSAIAGKDMLTAGRCSAALLASGADPLLKIPGAKCKMRRSEIRVSAEEFSNACERLDRGTEAATSKKNDQTVCET